MIGAIIGDIVGSRWEFNPTNDYEFEWLSDQNGFTDDTICTVAVADALLHGRDFGESIHDWCNRYPHPMGGYGGRFAQWVHSENPLPYNSSSITHSNVAMSDTCLISFSEGWQNMTPSVGKVYLKALS